MKRQFVIVLVCILITTVIIGCGGNAPLPKPTGWDKVEASATAIPTAKENNFGGKGSTWQDIGSCGGDVKMYNATYYDEDNGLAVGENGTVCPTFGRYVKTCSIVNFYGVAYGSQTMYYICGNQGQVLKSTNRGVTFSQVARFGDSEPNQCCLMSFCDETNGIIASQKRMAITSDGAKKWVEVKVPSDILSIYMLSPKVLYFVDKNLNLQKSVDAGKTWSKTPMEFYQKENTLKEIGKIALYVEKDNTYTIFCSQNIMGKFKKFTSYSTADNWESFMFNVLPNRHYQIDFLNINHTGDIVTIMTPSDYCILSKEKNDAQSE